MSDDKDEIRKMLSAPPDMDRLPCATIGCTRPSAVQLMCAEHYDFYMKLGAAYAQVLEYRRIAEQALKVGLEECERLRVECTRLQDHCHHVVAVVEQAGYEARERIREERDEARRYLEEEMSSKDSQVILELEKELKDLRWIYDEVRKKMGLKTGDNILKHVSRLPVIKYENEWWQQQIPESEVTKAHERHCERCRGRGFLRDQGEPECHARDCSQHNSEPWNCPDCQGTGKE